MSSVTETKKRRQWKKLRAHVNPLSKMDGYDFFSCPANVEWGRYFTNKKAATIADVGCGFGGLLEALSPLFPEEQILGMEIRRQVVESVQKRIAKLQHESSSTYQNIGVVNTNVMKYISTFFGKAQLEKMFFCFPDPHFKKSNHRRRIISQALLSEYAYFLKEGAKLYTITDVLDLSQWMTGHLTEHPLFERVSEEELSNDVAIAALHQTDEANKVVREGRQKYIAVFRRIPDKYE